MIRHPNQDNSLPTTQPSHYTTIPVMIRYPNQDNSLPTLHTTQPSHYATIPVMIRHPNQDNNLPTMQPSHYATIPVMIRHPNQDNILPTLHTTQPSHYATIPVMIRHLPRHTTYQGIPPSSAQLRWGPNQDDLVFSLLNHPSYDKMLTSLGISPPPLSFAGAPIIHVMAQIFKSGDLSNLIRSFDSISGGFLSNYFNAR